MSIEIEKYSQFQLLSLSGLTRQSINHCEVQISASSAEMTHNETLNQSSQGLTYHL